jgi:formylglycine-generating enzyme required for sulfatase activity
MTSHSRSDSDGGIHPVLADFALRLEEGEELDLDEWCSKHPGLATALRRLADDWGKMEELLPRQGLEGEGLLAWGATEELDSVTSGFLDRLAAHHVGEDRYHDRAAVGEGGMAVVRKVWDGDLRREVAMKRIRERGGRGSTPAGALSRFLDEAQIMGQLHHPGIVPVHELGVDAEGQIYFTMELVEGRDLSEILELLREGREGWTQARALGVIRQVCEAMAYAHSKGVVHRDLKPANVMVGRFGEVFVMDWGLARVLGQPMQAGRSKRGAPSTHRQDLADSDTGVVLETMEGEVVGTAAYMSPEQAAGRRSAISPRSDVYSVGTLLYELVAGHPPFVERGEKVTRSVILERVIAGSPMLLHRERRGIPDELTAIVEKAMARTPGERYASMMEMANDVRAYLEGRAVNAHRTGAWVELKKWVARNRVTAAAILTVILLAVFGAILVLGLQDQRRVEAQRLADGALVATLELEAEGLWPAVPELLPRMERWLERARIPAGRLPDHEAVLASMRERAKPYAEADELSDRQAHPAQRELQRLVSQITAIEEGHPELAIRAVVADYPEGSPAEQRDHLEKRRQALEESTIWRRTWLFDDISQQQTHDAVSEVVRRLRELTDPDPLVGAVASIRSRIELAHAIERRLGGEDIVRWEEAIASIADRGQCPLYDGLKISPQVGLVPLRRDPGSSLWEFSHIATGEVPVVDAAGDYLLTGETGVVLVLIPPGWATMGAIRPTEAVPIGPNIDRHAAPSEYPLDTTHLEPFFIGKHEFTQGQWKRAAGENPSTVADGYVLEGTVNCSDLTFPVETVNWVEVSAELRKLGLCPPTEAQWEYAARAGTGAPWWTGFEERLLSGMENLADHSCARIFPGVAQDPMSQVLEDGYPKTCPVDALESNPWGLFQMLGNVAEWCQDYFVVDLRWPTRPGDGLRLEPQDFQLRVYRGGSFLTAPVNARVSKRHDTGPMDEDVKIGFRAARPLDPDRTPK